MKAEQIETHIAAGLEWNALWDAMKERPDSWITTTEAMYWEMLECVPPRAHVAGAFLVGEAERHNEQGQPVYACFRMATKDTFFAKYMTLTEFWNCQEVTA